MWTMLQRLLKKIVHIRLSHSAAVGLLATVSDLVSLTLLVEWAALTPDQANLPSLALGSLIQFFGHRHYVFRAWDGRLSRQVVLFALAEAGGVGLNALAFHWIVNATTIPFQLVRVLGGAIVFIAFSFPLWRWIFRTPQTIAWENTLREADHPAKNAGGGKGSDHDDDTPSPAALWM